MEKGDRTRSKSGFGQRIDTDNIADDCTSPVKHNKDNLQTSGWPEKEPASEADRVDNVLEDIEDRPSLNPREDYREYLVEEEERKKTAHDQTVYVDWMHGRFCRAGGSRDERKSLTDLPYRAVGFYFQSETLGGRSPVVRS